MTSDAANLNLAWASLIVEEMSRCGIDTVFAAPGSRCAPLTVAAARHDRLRLVTHYDERGLGFAACGYAAGAQRPVAVVTTSGTAVANLFPAVIEASLRALPLLLVTADRPPELRDVSANQTIDQVKLFGRYVEWFVDLPCPTDSIEPAYVLGTVDHAIERMARGPVHLNCMFREPLMPAADETPGWPEGDRLAGWRAGDRAHTTLRTGGARLGAEEMDSVRETIAGRKGVIIAGEQSGAPQDVLRLAGQLAWPVLPDITSGIRGGHGAVITYADLLLADAAYGDGAEWEIVLHLGGRVTSKRLLGCLALRDPAPYMHVHRCADRWDPVHRVTDRIAVDASQFCRDLLEHEIQPADSGWLAHWQAGQRRCEEALEQFFAENAELSEPAVAVQVSKSIPADHVLFLGNSMPVRDFHAFATEGLPAAVLANRGASGIDGNVATSAGIVLGGGRPVTAVIGDLALLHDMNSLHMIRDLAVTVIVINNDGSGIFSFLPIADQSDVFEPYFATPHGLDFQQAAEQFHVPYLRPTTMEEFSRAYEEHVGAPALIEVQTDRGENRQLHATLERCVIDALNRS